MASIEQARAAKEQLRTTLQGRTDVRGIGIARTGAGYEIRVNVSRDGRHDLPAMIDGVDVHVRVVGAVHAGV
ncbi:hypothetical protein ACPPVS_17980 [Cellulomonas sp. McL0617]|uniref:hypothetical protein n=1 Tax=Cellulomonas sp. McL0617 TaxID=3415675 RepID=UPI003CEAFE8E